MHERLTKDDLVDLRLTIARSMLMTARDYAIPENCRSALWHVATAIQPRNLGELELTDAFTALYHYAYDMGLDPLQAQASAELHARQERRKGYSNYAGTQGDDHEGGSDGRLVIHCLDNGTFWDERSDVWVEDIRLATTYPAHSQSAVPLPGGKCAWSEIRVVKDMISEKAWPVLRGKALSTPA